MAKAFCPYCNEVMQDYLLNSHKLNCKAKPAQVELVPPPVIEDTPITDMARLVVAAIHDEHPERGPWLPPTDVINAPFIPLDVPEKPWEKIKDNGNENKDDGIFHPISNPYFVVPQDLGFKLDRLIKASLNHPKNILLTGPQGAGKTSLGQQLAAKDKRACYIAPCVTMQEPGQWWGYMGVSPERGTFYVPSKFVKALETPGCVIILDDMNRVENPKVLNPLFPLLDDRRETYLDDLGRTIKVAANVIFIGTVNEGFQFQGTDPIDLALRDRFDQIEVQYPPDIQIREILIKRTGIGQGLADQLSKFARQLADHPNPDERVFISMRQMIAIAEDVVLGGSIRDAVTFTIAAGLSDETIEKVRQILQTILQDDYTARKPDWRPWA